MSGRLLRRIGKTIICVALGAVILFNSPVVSRAYDDTVSISEDTYNTLTKGTRVYNGVDYGAKYGYNPLYYFLNYNDLRIAYGADPAKLVEHYAVFGIKENRVANRQITRGAHSWGSSNEYIVPSSQLTSKQSNGMTVIPEQLHNSMNPKSFPYHTAVLLLQLFQGCLTEQVPQLFSCMLLNHL